MINILNDSIVTIENGKVVIDPNFNHKFTHVIDYYHLESQSSAYRIICDTKTNVLYRQNGYKDISGQLYFNEQDWYEVKRKVEVKNVYR